MSATVGILGGGQLGRMLALAGHPLGIRTRCLDRSASAPAASVSELVIGDYEDERALARLAECDVVSFEWESVPERAARWLAERVLVLPPPDALAVAQDRLHEKTSFVELGIPTPRFEPAASAEELEAAVALVGTPAVVKTRRLGYDGKGQRVVKDPSEAASVFAELGGAPLIVEAFVRFERELSVLGVRNRAGDTAFYPLVENHHQAGMLQTSIAPAPRLTPELQGLAESHTRRLLERFDYVGVLALELFDTGTELVANEIAPRVHNSGHWTIEGAVTSQFENHLRAILDLPLGATDALGPCAMLNLIGAMPDARRVLAIEDAHLHDYCKAPRSGRKLGHITLRAPDPPTLESRVNAARTLLV